MPARFSASRQGASAQSWLVHQAAFDLWQMEQERKKLAKQVQRIDLREDA
jgi:plasmid maintenance system antidote protein VapI